MTQPTLPQSGKKERVVWIDQLKGVAFFFVILGHMGIPATLESWIFSFHMPIYFFITGLHFNIDKLAQQKPLDYLKKLAQRLLIPYVWLQLLSMCLRFLQNTVLQHTETPAALYLRGMLYANSKKMDAPSNPLYFVLLLFMAEAALYFLIRLTKGSRPFVFGLTILLLPLSLLTQSVPLPWHVNVVPTVMFMILCGEVLGRFYRANEERIKALTLPRALLWAAALFALGAVLWYCNGRTSIHGNEYGKDFLPALLAALSTSVALALLTMRLPKMAWLNLAGQNTLLFMGLHKPMLLCMEAVFPQQKTTAWFILCAAVLCYAIMLPLALWFRSFAPFAIGVNSDFSDWKIKVGQAVCLVGATCVPYLYAVNHLKDGLLRSTPLYTCLAAAAYLAICAALYFVFRRYIRFPFLPETQEAAA